MPKGARRALKCSGGHAGRFESRPKAAVASKGPQALLGAKRLSDAVRPIGVISLQTMAVFKTADRGTLPVSMVILAQLGSFWHETRPKRGPFSDVSALDRQF